MSAVPTENMPDADRTVIEALDDAEEWLTVTELTDRIDDPSLGSEEVRNVLESHREVVRRTTEDEDTYYTTRSHYKSRYNVLDRMSDVARSTTT